MERSDRSPSRDIPPPPPNFPGWHDGGHMGTYGRPAPPGPLPDNNLVLAIFSVICCTPFGIAAIVFASQVQTKWLLGDYEGALNDANKARTFGWLGIILGLVAPALYFICSLIFLVSAPVRTLP